MPVQCAFCGSAAKLTKEHVWSSGVLRLFEPTASKTFDEMRGIVHEADPVLRDLCRDCNSGLSHADAAAINFTQSNLLSPVNFGAPLVCEASKLKLWVTKTASNFERGHKSGDDWWKAYTRAFRQLETLPARTSVFFAPWQDSSMNFGQVHDLAASTGFFGVTRTRPPEELTDLFERIWVLKVGFGAFALFVAREGVENAFDALNAEIGDWGWCSVEDSITPRRSPFNMFTTITYFFLAPPDASRDEISAAVRRKKKTEAE